MFLIPFPSLLLLACLLFCISCHWNVTCIYGHTWTCPISCEMLLARDFSAHCICSPSCQPTGYTLKKRLKHCIWDPALLVSRIENISLSCLRDGVHIVRSFLNHSLISYFQLQRRLCILKETEFSNYFIDTIFSYHGYRPKLIFLLLKHMSNLSATTKCEQRSKMLKAFPPYWFTFFSTLRFRGLAIGIFASAQATSQTSAHLNQQCGPAAGSPGWKAGHWDSVPSRMTQCEL